jgi:hypothetical protein
MNVCHYSSNLGTRETDGRGTRTINLVLLVETDHDMVGNLFRF